MRRFPESFLWGACLSAHQVEGGDFDSDWWRWEQGRGRIHDASTSQTASDHLARRCEDYALARKLGHSAHLFTLSWARIQPREGVFDDSALHHYDEAFDALHKNRLEPVCALCHVTAPQWFTEHYGWHNPAAPRLFAAYAERVVASAAGKCRWWIPILEPMHQVGMQYMAGAWPPQHRNPQKALRALSHMLEAHAAAYRIIHSARTGAMVGAAIRSARFQPREETSSWDLRAARREERRCNHVVLNALMRGEWPLPFGAPREIQGTADFVGLSYYGARTVRFNPWRPARLFASALQGSEDSHAGVDPVGLLGILRGAQQYERPILITGNGIDTNNDHERCRFLLDHLAVLSQAIRGGIDLRGYLHRSLLDGFEWREGYAPRFGLVHVARETLARTPNPSAYLFKDICETGTFRRGTIERYCPDWIPPVGMEEP